MRYDYLTIVSKVLEYKHNIIVSIYLSMFPHPKNKKWKKCEVYSKHCKELSLQLLLRYSCHG